MLKANNPKTYIIFAIFIAIVFLGLLSAAQFMASQKPKSSVVDDKKSVAQELEECLPKSDMASKRKCDELISGITNFNDCVDAGFPVRETYPEQCGTPDGRIYVREVPREITVSGSIICLPHKDTSGPITLECAIGIKSTDGNNYALSTKNLPQSEMIEISSLKSLTVTGTLVTDIPSASEKYDIVGVIEVSSFSSLE